MSGLMISDLRAVVKRIPTEVKDLLEDEPDLMVAGGFIRSIISGENINDLDIWGTNVLISKIAKDFATDTGGKVFESPRAITVTVGSLPVQFITAYHSDAMRDLLQKFDFTICQAAVQRHKNGNWVSECTDGFYPDLAARRLVYTNSNWGADQGQALLRMRRFLRAGYNIEVPSIARIVARFVSDLNKKNEVEIDNQDKFTAALIQVMTEVEPEVNLNASVEPQVETHGY